LVIPYFLPNSFVFLRLSNFDPPKSLIARWGLKKDPAKVKASHFPAFTERVPWQLGRGVEVDILDLGFWPPNPLNPLLLNLFFEVSVFPLGRLRLQ